MEAQAGLIARLLDERAPTRDIIEATRKLHLGPAPSKVDWLAGVGAVARVAASDLEWLTPRDRRWVMGCVLEYVVKSQTSSWTKEHPSGEESEAALLPFLTWLANQQDECVLGFCWDILAFRPRRYGTGNPVHWLKRSSRLAAGISYENIKCAIALADEATAMFWWPEERWRVVRWDRDSQVYTNFASHSSYVVRAASAKAFGALFHGCSTKQTSADTPALPDVMSWIQAQERRTAGIAGPFLHGAQWRGGLMELAPGYDFRSWFLETLRTSDREPDVPHMIPLEFHAHEYFRGDAQAIEEILRMGRYYLAVLTATEAPRKIEDLQDVLNKMANSDHPGVATAIRAYLAERETHAGLELFEEHSLATAKPSFPTP